METFAALTAASEEAGSWNTDGISAAGTALANRAVSDQLLGTATKVGGGARGDLSRTTALA